MKSENSIECSKIIPLTGILNQSPLLNTLHKSVKLEIPEINNQRRALSNIFNRLGIDNIQQVIISEPKLNKEILSELANNFFTSSFPQKAEELIRKMSMPEYGFTDPKQPSPSTLAMNTVTQPQSDIQKQIIEEIKQRSAESMQEFNQQKNESNNKTNEIDLNNFF